MTICMINQRVVEHRSDCVVVSFHEDRGCSSIVPPGRESLDTTSELVYPQLDEIPQRANVVENRVQQHANHLGRRLEELRTRERVEPRP
jgi:hypothetical protein